MNLEMFQIPAYMAVLFAITSLILIPTAAMAMSRLPMEVSAKNTDSSDGAGCDLPPYVEIEGRGAAAFANGLPPLDKEIEEDYKTATFAMG